MENKIDLILEELKEIKLELEILKNDISNIKNQTNKMDTHVDFINSIYDKVEAPMNFVVDNFNSFLLT